VSQLVVQAPARRGTSYKCPLYSGTRHSQVDRAAHMCGMLGNAKGEPLWLYSDHRRNGSCMPPRITKRHRLDRLSRGCVVLESLRVRASALGNAGSGMQTKGCTEQ